MSPKRRAAAARPSKRFAECFAGEEISGLELEMRRHDGSPLWVRRLDAADARRRRGNSGGAFDLGRRHRPRACRGRACPAQEQNLYLQQELKSVHNFEEIVGRSPALPRCSTRFAGLPPRMRRS